MPELKNLRGRLLAAEGIDVRQVDERLEPVLVALARSGMPARPRQLGLSNVRWGGAAAVEIGVIDVQEDGSLHLEATPPCDAALVPHPES